YGAESLRQLVPAGCTFGYDVLVFVGRALFLRQRRAQEIIQELQARQIQLSPSEVGYLGKKFVVYLALAHRQSAPRLKQALRAQGGYILHLDGTGEGGGPMLMSSLDSLSEIVLGNVKVPSEKTERIVPFLEQIKRRFGVPVAAVHDMGPGILAAVQRVFPGVPDFVCHFHFLRDAGKDLLAADYDAIRQRLRQHGLTEKLLYYARRFKAALDEQPSLVQRFCQDVQDHCLPSQKLEVFPRLCAYALIQWALEGKSASAARATISLRFSAGQAAQASRA
ncbi:MAG: transposase, partial [Verrucomicrobia bacterium]|nr:transposase [Verrucomicrobiota bacterium]